MGMLSGRRQRLQQFKDRKRRVKRKQAARIVAAGLLAVLAIVLVVVVIRALSGLRPKNAMTIPQTQGQNGGAKSPAAGSSIQLAFAQQFKPAPWFVAVDDRRLYVGEPDADAKPNASGYPLSQIEAFPLDAKQRLWSTPLQANCRELGISGQTLVAVADDPGGAVLCGYELTSGKPKWSIKPVAGMDVQIVLDSRTVVAGYTPQNGGAAAQGKLVGYNSATGARRWGIDLSRKLKGFVSTNDACCGGNPHLELQCWEGLASYRLHNVIGLIDTRSGFIREFAASEHILGAEADPARKACYLVFSTAQNAYRLVHLPYDGKARTIADFQSDGQFLLLADDGYVALAYGVPGESPLTQMACFKGTESKPSLEAQFEGLPVDLATMESHSGQFLLALSTKIDDDGQPAGRSTVQLANCGAGKVVQAASLRRPVLMLAPFGDSCMALMRGGDIQLLDTTRGQSRRLRHARYEYLEAYTSADEKSLLVSSYPESYLGNTPGSPMQVMVFK